VKHERICKPTPPRCDSSIQSLVSWSKEAYDVVQRGSRLIGWSKNVTGGTRCKTTSTAWRAQAGLQDQRFLKQGSVRRGALAAGWSKNVTGGNRWSGGRHADPRTSWLAGARCGIQPCRTWWVWRGRIDVAGFDQRVIRIIDGHKVLLECISTSLSVVDGSVNDVLCCDN
jgi:hypothetical protein